MRVKGAVRPVFLALLVPTLLLSLVLTVLYIFMKVVQRIYAEQNPDSVLPALSRAGTYLLIALAIAVGMVRVWPD
jgi:TRAP-type C4-dicarboxylate transport system permease large subunit